MGIGQRQIDQFFTKKLKNDQNDNQTSDKSESPVELAQSIDLTMTESDNEDNTSEKAENKNVKIREFNICGLSPFAELESKCERKRLETNLHRIERRPRKPPKKPDMPWFYYLCDEKCPPDCEDHHTTEIEMKHATAEERKRVDYYRNQIKWRGNYECAIEYILDYQRKNGHDFYKVKWSGWPETAWQWVHISDIDALEKIRDFRKAMIAVLPVQELPRQIGHQRKYIIPAQYIPLIQTEYKKEKDKLRNKLLVHQERLRKIDPTVLLENEEDLSDFPSAEKYNFIKTTTYALPDEEREEILDQISTGKEVFICNEHCGDCSKLFHDTFEMHWYGSKGRFQEPIERPVHYERDGTNWTVKHGKKYFIVECTQDCLCKQDELQLIFLSVIFKSADARGWGLKCLTEIKKGAPVIEYVGEMINMKEFYQREKAQEESGTMYCLELPQNAEDSKQYCIDSGFKGNHARFINHSCDPNLEIYRVFRDDRNPNRAVPVLFARRNIKIGEELSFNYRMITTETLKSDDEDDAQSNEIRSERRNFKCLCNARICPDKVWTEAELEVEKRKEEAKQRRRENAKKSKSSLVGEKKKRGRAPKRKRDSLNDSR